MIDLLFFGKEIFAALCEVLSNKDLRGI